MNITLERLHTQRLAGPGFGHPADVVRWFGAVQAQDYAGALWAIGLRTDNAMVAEVEQAVRDRLMVRTWPLRGTLHFAAAADVRWMLTLVAPRMIARAALRFRQLELNERTIARSAAVFVDALQGGRQLSRPRLYALLERSGISTAANRGLYLLWRCAHDGLVCFAAPEGKQQTFALLEEWVPGAKRMERTAALAELACRYFTSHGPATIKDFIWWSGLAASDARCGLEDARTQLVETRIAGASYWHAPHRTIGTTSRAVANGRPARAILLPPYDEYTVAYRDRSAALDPRHAAAARNGIFSPTIVIDGRIAGTWTRRLAGDAVVVTPATFTPLTGARARAVAAAAERYGRFLDRASRLA